MSEEGFQTTKTSYQRELANQQHHTAAQLKDTFQLAAAATSMSTARDTDGNFVRSGPSSTSDAFKNLTENTGGYDSDDNYDWAFDSTMKRPTAP